MTITRYDSSPITSFERTPTGGLRLKANFARVGVQVYKMSDGTTRREYRPPEEVFRPDSIASFIGAPVTDTHPPDFVTPENFSKYGKGHLLGAAPGRSHVLGVLDVNDAALIAKVESGEAKEISMGYTADYDPTPGVSPEGEAYDGIQRQIMINHGALGPVGWGRGGSSVALRADSAYCISVDHDQERKRMTTKHRVDGIEYEAGSDAHIAAIEKERAALVKRADDAAGAVALAEKKATDEKARADAAELAASPAALHKRAAERARLIGLAAKHVPKFDATTPAAVEMGEDKIVAQILASVAPNLDTSGWTPEMMLAAVAALTAGATAAPATPPADNGMGAPPNAIDSIHAMRGSALVPPTKSEKPKNEKEAIAEKRRKDERKWEAKGN